MRNGTKLSEDRNLLEAMVGEVSFVERLFDRIPEVVFFLKDTRGRYVVVNRTLVDRCGLKSKDDLVGRTARDVFPAPLGDRFLEQDLAVAADGVPISQRLELHLYPTRREGWCLTDKEPLLGPGGEIIGITGISRDLQAPGEDMAALSELAEAVRHVRENYHRPLTVGGIARVAGLSVYQLNRRLGLLFGISARQFVTKTRIDGASQMLRSGNDSIAAIAHACGYYDQSAFSRVFRRTVGLTPRQYRCRHRSPV